MSRALVLGGGGPVGIAWEMGLLAGLEEAGVRLAEADFVLGTSAGAFVGSQIAMQRPLAEMAAAILREAERPRGPAGLAPPIGQVTAMLAEARKGAMTDPEGARRRIGAMALATPTIDEATFIRGFGRALAETQADLWPTRNYACTAVDAESGEFVIWNADSRIGLARAVASSCSVPGVFPPITIGGRRYMDGGVRSATNADLATGYERVAVLAVRLGGDGEEAAELAGPLEAELQALRDNGAKVELIGPDAASAAAFGPNLLDSATRPAVAQAALAQGRALAPSLAAFWR